MVSGDVINDWRRAVNEPNTNRFTVQDSLDFLNKACVQVAMSLNFPQATWPFNTVANQQEYAMLETIRVLRIYILGPNGQKQLIEGTDIPTMEGENQNYYDASSGVVQGNPTLTPQWIAEQPVQYPYQSIRHQGFGKPTSLWCHGDPPRWYFRGGNIGFVPPPNGVFEVVVDHVPIPPVVTSLSSILEFFPAQRDALVHKMAEYSRQADGSSASVRNQQQYEMEIKKNLDLLDKRQISRSQVMMPWVRRNRRNGGRGGWGNGWGGWY